MAKDVISVRATGKAFEVLETLGKEKDKALMRACNRTADWARTQEVKGVTSILNVKRKDLDGRHRMGGVTVEKAKPQKLESHVKTTGNRIPAYRFGGKPNDPPATRQPVSYAIRDGQRRKLSQNAFFAQLKSGHQDFWRRRGSGKHRLIVAMTGKRAGKKIWSEGNIGVLYGPSIPRVVQDDPKLQQLLNVDSAARFELETTRQVNFILTGNSSGAEVSDGGLN